MLTYVAELTKVNYKIYKNSQYLWENEWFAWFFFVWNLLGSLSFSFVPHLTEKAMF